MNGEKKFDYQTIGQTDEGIATIAGTKRRNPYVRRGGTNCYEFTKSQAAKHEGKTGTEDGVRDSSEAAHGPRFFHGWRTLARGHDLRDRRKHPYQKVAGLSSDKSERHREAHAADGRSSAASVFGDGTVRD